ncbi:MAG: DUF2249 domain-containing protein [Gammaproteobacteria bacterium]|nr:DUF2249 domain-containing protein [Gammaproteobacteria bacterium]MBU1655888.1 DUF2249 domain-containing protein [Gammaproteobacteria bacterium]MBU1961015.1 DUF2249 domain-containing protein [Gammaproteobacteria bacterium]
MERILDVSTLEAPEPLERILDGLAEMSPGDWLRVLHRREPYPLYNMLRNMGYNWSALPGTITAIEILIWPEGQEPPPGAELC